MDGLLTLREVASAVKVSEMTVRRAVRGGELKHHRVGKKQQIRVSEQAVADWLRLRASPAHALHAVPETVSVSTVQAENTTDVQGLNGVREGYVGNGSTYRILTADVTAGLKALDEQSVSALVTSPPYFWQRDYNVEGQIGHEATIGAYVENLVTAFDHARVALRDDGLLFLNIGDTYYNAKGKPHGRDKKHAARMLARQTLRAVDGPGLGLPRKSLIGLPWRVALAMQQRGWTLRASIIWHRPNALGEPTSHDRPWRTTENIFMFSKGPKYYFNREGLNGEEDVWTISARPKNPYAHCAPFPEELVRRCLDCGCPEGGVVCDPFLGSGTTALAALKSGRSAIGIELNASFAEQAEKRIIAEVSGATARRMAPRQAA